MKILEDFIKWFKGGNVTEQTEEAPSRYDFRMIGEPVISFVESYKREPKRYKIQHVDYNDPRVSIKSFEKYPWMNDTLYILQDLKTGRNYTFYMDEDRSGPNKVYKVYDLPFNLNHWELFYLGEEIKNHRMAAKVRRENILCARNRRLRKEKEVIEQATRLEFSKQFRPGDQK